jgi:hypothetical protein
MATKLTIPASNTWNAAPSLFQASSGRYHCVYWYDDGAGTEGLWHTYLDDFITGWDTGQALTANAPGPQAGPSFAGVVQKDSGRIMVYFGDDANGDLYSVYSDDDGVTWSSPALFLSTIKASSLVKQVKIIVTDTDRWLFAVVYDNSGGGAPYDIYTFYSDDEGATSSTSILQGIRNRFTNHPQVGLFQIRYGKVLLVAVDDTGDDLRIVRSSDRGETWETFVDIYTNPATIEIGPALTQLFTGELLCAFETNEDGTPDIKLMRSSDGGFTWGTKTLVYSSGSAERRPSILPYTRDVILCSFQSGTVIRMMTSTDGGTTWGSLITISSGVGTHSAPHMIRLANGDILCAYTRLSAGTYYIDVVRSTDGGSSWGSNINVTSETHGIDYSWLFEAEDGTILCSYSDPTQNAHKITRSSDNGVTWDTPTVLFTPPTSLVWGTVIFQLDDSTLAALINPRFLITSSDGGFNWSQVITMDGFSSSLSSIIKLESGRFVLAFSQNIGGSNYELYATHSPDGKNWEYNEVALDNISEGVVGGQLPDGDNLLWLLDTVLGEPIVRTGYSEDGLQWDADSHIVGVRYVDGPPPIGIHDALITSSILYAYTDWGGASSALYTLYVQEEDQVSLIDELESFTGMEAPQIVLKWESPVTEQTTGADGVTNIGVDAFNFNSATATFTTDVQIGDRLIIENATPSAVDGTYVIVEVTDDNNIKILNAFGSSVGSLDYRVVRNMADKFELRRKEFEYPVDPTDGNLCRLDDPISDQDDPFYGDPGEEVLTGADGATVAPNIFNSVTGGFSGVVNIGDELTVSDTGDVRNNDTYIIIEVTDDNNLKVHRDFPVAAVGSLDFAVWHGPRPFLTYYYSLFVERIKAEPLFGRDRLVYQTWCFAGGTDQSDIYPTFKTELFASMPKVYRDRDVNKLTSSPDQVIEFGEVIFRDASEFIAGHLERLARLTGLFFQRAQDLIDNYPAAWSLVTAPPPVLLALGEMLGQPVNQQVQNMRVNRWRKYLRILPVIFQRKGTPDAIYRTARFYGYEIGEDDLVFPVLRAHFDSAETVVSGTAGVTTNPNVFSDAGGGFSSALEDQWLYILDSTSEADNGIYQIRSIINDTTILLEQNFPTGGLAGLTWRVFDDVPFDRTTLDSYDPSWAAILLFALYKDSVYQLWSDPDTQFVFEEIRKVAPFYLSLQYNEEVP